MGYSSIQNKKLKNKVYVKKEFKSYIYIYIYIYNHKTLQKKYLPKCFAHRAISHTIVANGGRTSLPGFIVAKY